jgi:hypothetical protein
MFGWLGLDNDEQLWSILPSRMFVSDAKLCKSRHTARTLKGSQEFGRRELIQGLRCQSSSDATSGCGVVWKGAAPNALASLARLSRPLRPSSVARFAVSPLSRYACSIPSPAFRFAALCLLLSVAPPWPRHGLSESSGGALTV